MKPEDFIVFIVDDDMRMREALSELLASLGWQAVAFGSAGEYVAYRRPDLPACLAAAITRSLIYINRGHTGLFRGAPASQPRSVGIGTRRCPPGYSERAACCPSPAAERMSNQGDAEREREGLCAWPHERSDVRGTHSASASP